MTKRYSFYFVISMLMTVVYWITDSIGVVAFLPDTTFISALLTDIPAHHLYIRFLASAIILIGGILLSRAMRKVERSKQKLEISENRLITTFQSIADGVITTDRNLNINLINRIGKEILEIDEKNDFIGKSLFELLKLGDNSKSLVEQDLYQKAQQVISTGIVAMIPKIEIAFENGSKILEDSMAPIYNNNEIDGLVIVFRDITDKMKNEKKTKELESQLAQSSKMEAIGQLSGGIAHDFNNILTGITGYVEILENNFKKCPNHDEIKVIPQLDKIKESINKASSLTKKLMTFNQNQIAENKIININAVIFGFREMLIKSMGESIQLDLVLNSTNNIKADATQIEQIILNMAINAKDAILTKDSDNKRVLIETSDVVVDEEFISSHIGVVKGNYVLLKFSDTGCGMSQYVKERAFEPFFTTKGRGRGTGLGLYSVYSIIKQNKAAIYVESELNVGTTFKVYWPASDEPLTQKIKKKKSGPGRGDETVLLVEDDDQIREVCREYLQQMGFTVIDAADGSVALKKAQNEKIDIVVTDVIMPHMDGFELVRNLVQCCPKIKILFTSGYTDNYIKNTIILNGEINFISKPYSLIALTQKIREILDQ